MNKVPHSRSRDSLSSAVLGSCGAGASFITRAYSALAEDAGFATGVLYRAERPVFACPQGKQTAILWRSPGISRCRHESADRSEPFSLERSAERFYRSIAENARTTPSAPWPKSSPKKSASTPKPSSAGWPARPSRRRAGTPTRIHWPRSNNSRSGNFACALVDSILTIA